MADTCTPERLAELRQILGGAWPYNGPQPLPAEMEMLRARIIKVLQDAADKHDRLATEVERTRDLLSKETQHVADWQKTGENLINRATAAEATARRLAKALRIARHGHPLLATPEVKALMETET